MQHYKSTPSSPPEFFVVADVSTLISFIKLSYAEGWNESFDKGLGLWQN